MADNGDRNMIENVTRESFAVVPMEEGAAKRPPVGHVERLLNFKDRNNLFGACRAFCAKEGHKGFKDQTKLDRLNKIINFDETLEYFAMIDDSLEDETRAWHRAKLRHKLWKDYKAGLVKPEDFRKEFSDQDPEPLKPSLLAPVTKPDDIRGKERSFYLPSKIDVWAQDAIRAMDWSPFLVEYTVELFQKFGIHEEE